MENQISSGSLRGTLKRVKPYVAMVSLQFGYAGLYIVSVLCLKRGLSHYVLTVYRHFIATLVIAPFAFVLERKVRPKLTSSTFLKIMALALLEPVLDQNIYCIALTYTSATYVSALYNIVPAVTFIMAIMFRIEKIKIKKVNSQVKVLGTVLTVVGVMVMTLYKGSILEFVWSRGRGHHETTDGAVDMNWIMGTVLIIASSVCWSGFFILQAFTLKAYPAELSLTTLLCFMGMVEGGAVALVMDHKASSWSIGWDSRLLAPVYLGIVCTAMAYYVQGVVTKERGPVFVAYFNPLCMFITAVLGSFILAEEIRLGRVIGAVIIVVGVYSVVWGKSKDPLETSTTIKKMESVPELPITDTSKTISDDFVSDSVVNIVDPPK